MRLGLTLAGWEEAGKREQYRENTNEQLVRFREAPVDHSGIRHFPSLPASGLHSVGVESILPDNGQYFKRPPANLDQRCAGDRYDVCYSDAGIDLSVGSVAALTGIVAASLATTSAAASVAGGPYPAIVAIAAGLAVGCACGALVGWIVSRFSVPAFVATLGMLSAARGMTLIYGGGKPVPALIPDFRWIGTAKIMGIPMPVIILAIVFIGAGGFSRARASAVMSMLLAVIHMQQRHRVSTSLAFVSLSMSSPAHFPALQV